ncbi:MAG: hypothetical protein CM15mP59_1170 [Flavobacteriaceae bacterium]|nr:MAG: hypothetical protein CM15mP59_1170 [Flavobacteriaceae bacterium]
MDMPLSGVVRQKYQNYKTKTHKRSFDYPYVFVILSPNVKTTTSISKRRAVRSYFGIVFSVSLILFVVGVLSLLLLNARQVSQHVKEQIVLTIFIDDNAKE